MPILWGGGGTWGAGMGWGGPGGAGSVVPPPPVVAGHGWGRDSFGWSPYGASVIGTGLSVVSAFAISTNSVQITLSGVPQNNNYLRAGDALNPATWMVQRQDTMAFFDVAQVQIVEPTIYVVFVFEPFGSVAVTHTISTNSLLDQSGNLISPPRSANFSGILYEGAVSPNAKAVARGVYSQDIANPQAALLANNAFGGTLVVTSGGDYALVSGPDLVKKLIIRRLTTRVGTFFHLPNYGINLPLNQPVPFSSLPSLQAQAQQQVLMEPEVATCSVTVSIDVNSGVLTFNVQAVLKVTGAVVSCAVPVNLNSPAFPTQLAA